MNAPQENRRKGPDDRRSEALPIALADRRKDPPDRRLANCLCKFVRVLTRIILRYAECCRLPVQDAHDAVEQARWEALQHIDSGQAAKHPNWKAWLVGRAKRRLLDRVQRRRTFVSLVAVEIIPPRRWLHAAQDLREARLECIREAFEALDPRDQDLLTLRLYDRLDYADLCRRLNLSNGALRRRLADARRCWRLLAQSLLSRDGLLE